MEKIYFNDIQKYMEEMYTKDTTHLEVSVGLACDGDKHYSVSIASIDVKGNRSIYDLYVSETDMNFFKDSIARFYNNVHTTVNLVLKPKMLVMLENDSNNVVTRYEFEKVGLTLGQFNSLGISSIFEADTGEFLKIFYRTINTVQVDDSDKTIVEDNHTVSQDTTETSTPSHTVVVTPKANPQDIINGLKNTKPKTNISKFMNETMDYIKSVTPDTVPINENPLDDFTPPPPNVSQVEQNARDAQLKEEWKQKFLEEQQKIEASINEIEFEEDQ